MTVMVVEDNVAIRENVSEILQDEGYKPVCAENGRDALYFLRAQRALPAAGNRRTGRPQGDSIDIMARPTAVGPWTLRKR